MIGIQKGTIILTTTHVGGRDGAGDRSTTEDDHGSPKRRVLRVRVMKGGRREGQGPEGLNSDFAGPIQGRDSENPKP